MRPSETPDSRIGVMRQSIRPRLVPGTEIAQVTGHKLNFDPARAEAPGLGIEPNIVNLRDKGINRRHQRVG